MAAKVLIVDDVAENRKLLASILQKNADCDIMMAKSGQDVIELFENRTDNLPDLILLDIMMPVMSGIQVAQYLNDNKLLQEIPIIFVTGLGDVDNIVKAFKVGGVDYITKPFNKAELIARVNTHLKLKRVLNELEVKNSLLQNSEIHLIHLVEEKTKKVNNLTVALITALENANIYNDIDTGNHIKRVSAYSVLLAENYGCSLDFIKKIKVYSPLHDIGKVGIPDNILKKKGKYSEDEYEKMKEHVVIGFKILDSPEIDAMAKNIALYHHEKWDGSGYIEGLKSESIPLEARIVALADVYDALMNQRIYKEAYTKEKTERIIKTDSGLHFDPKIVDIFIEQKNRFYEISKQYSD
ncbi:MAG: response regulator [Spirochaetales bacterium]|nr:response regulator [Spirochaetales bacterium]